MQKLDVRPSKRLGQNFILDNNILQRIVKAAEINSDDIILEIGTGIGNLTRHLCEKAKFVYSVEKDTNLCRIAEENLREFDNVKIICNDVLKINVGAIHELPLHMKIVGNLPYYITTPIIFKLLEQRQHVSDIIIMVQKEVAERIIAKPGNKDYGILSCAVQFYANPEILFKINKAAFSPRPKVDSALIRIKLLKMPSVSVDNEDAFLKLIKSAFSQRRKTLANSLSAENILGLSKDKAMDALKKAGINYKRRAETLSLEEFARLYNLCCKFLL